MENSQLDHWPKYQIGPRESIFALGVVGVKYAQLEFALSGIFATTLGISMSLGSIMMPKLTNHIRLQLLRERLPSCLWSEEVQDMVYHFIQAFNICADNRNLLMHSNIASMSQDAIILYKTTREGKTVLCNPELRELRQVADEMESYFNYGLALTNAININLSDPTFTSGRLPWPDRPPLPRRLEYRSESMPVRPVRPNEGAT
jgi:hypothetical protein